MKNLIFIIGTMGVGIDVSDITAEQAAKKIFELIYQ